MTNPKGTWGTIANETASIKSIYLDYIIPLGAFLAICQFLGSRFVGYSVMGQTITTGTSTALTLAISSFIAHLISVYVVSWILNFLAPKFGGSTTHSKCLQLVAYAATPTYFSGVFGLFSIAIFGLMSIILGIYSIYLFWIGIDPMTSVPSDKKIPYTVVALISSIIAMIVIGMVVATITGAGAAMSVDNNAMMGKIDLNGTTIDPNELQKSMEQIQKMFPPK